jgi:hypothetical protein
MKKVKIQIKMIIENVKSQLLVKELCQQMI